MRPNTSGRRSIRSPLRPEPAAGEPIALSVHVRETVMSIGQSTKRSYWSGTLVIGAFCVVTSLTAPSLARAEGFLDFLFGVFQDHSSPKPQQQNGYPSAPPSAVGRIAPAPLGQESVNDAGGSTGHSVAFCVRLCDGHHFPMEQMVNGTPVETCRAICPYSRTKVFFGSEIGAAVAQDGQRYTALDTAFLHRKQLVADCTCNGRDAFGLSTFDVKRDPTLRPVRRAWRLLTMSRAQ